MSRYWGTLKSNAILQRLLLQLRVLPMAHNRSNVGEFKTEEVGGEEEEQWPEVNDDNRCLARDGLKDQQSSLEADANFKESKVNDLVYATISPILIDFKRTMGRNNIHYPAPSQLHDCRYRRWHGAVATRPQGNGATTTRAQGNGAVATSGQSTPMGRYSDDSDKSSFADVSSAYAQSLLETSIQ
ncbi:hypothetical protein DFH27DRAFT_12471 [Peziza echinospora]|nr:hypothetical protein DFH27DRAFT_12471 [Peziza echinospora]